MITLDDVRNAVAAYEPTLVSNHDKYRAAVAAILCDPSTGPQMLFIERSKHEKDPWSGHLAFPGGRMEEDDKTLRETAERETLEEVGLDLQSGEYLGRLDDVTGAVSPVVVSGFVYAVPVQEAFELSAEVQDAFWFTLADLVDLKRHTPYRILHRGAERSVPAIDLLGPHRPILWGLTYRFVAQFLRLLGHEIPGGPPVG